MKRLSLGLWLWLMLCFMPGLSGLAQPGSAPIVLSQRALEQGIALEGFWQLSGPDGSDFQVELPAAWERLYNQRLPYYGTGTYSLKLIVPGEMIGKPLKLYTDIFGGHALRVYANEQLVGFNGSFVGSLSRVPHFQSFQLRQRQLELKIVVSNHHLQWSGLVRPLWLGTAEAINRQMYRRSISANVIFGVFLFLCLFHLLLFVFYRQDKATLWFCLICLSASVYMEFFALHNLEYLLGDIPLEWSVKGVRLGLFGVLPCVFWYGRSLAPHILPLWLAQGVSLVCAALALTVVFPLRFHAPFINIWYLIACASFVYNFYLVFRLFKLTELAAYAYSSLIFAGTVFNDIFNALGWLNTGYYARYGVLAFCLTQSAFLAWRLQNNYRQSIQLQHKLESINHNLEQIVAQRTQEVQQQNEQLNQLMHFKEEMVEMLIHDIKTPLNVLLNLPQRGQAASRPETHNLASLRIKHLLEQLVSLNKNEQAQFDLQLGKHNLQLSLQRVLQLLQPWALSKEIQLTNLLPRESWVHVDIVLIERVFQNILDNALKHSPQGAEIIISGAATGQHFTVDFLDAGPGIAEAAKTQALKKYQSFSQADVPRSSGLGLYFCHQVLQAHGGKIELRNGPERGALVRIHLPRAQATQQLRFDFRAEQAQLLAPFMGSLKSLKTYQISELKTLLAAIQYIDDPLIQAWLKTLTEAIEDVNEAKYRKLIDQVPPVADH